MKTQDAPREAPTPADNRNEFPDLGALFDAHVEREFADHDLAATMKTMVPEPYVYGVPAMTGGFGGKGVRRFCGERFISQIPRDAKVTSISGAIGKDEVRHTRRTTARMKVISFASLSRGRIRLTGPIRKTRFSLRRIACVTPTI